MKSRPLPCAIEHHRECRLTPCAQSCIQTTAMASISAACPSGPDWEGSATTPTPHRNYSAELEDAQLNRANVPPAAADVRCFRSSGLSFCGTLSPIKRSSRWQLSLRRVDSRSSLFDVPDDRSGSKAKLISDLTVRLQRKPTSPANHYLRRDHRIGTTARRPTADTWAGDR